ncbi:MAG: hypothetical protein O2931_13125 [Planctomycetota bacterium]|nr:hypothetical protein [Planctomycetota bacterium]MDA1179726.1 hypothetical protein [Planctomycetota bacterium]
MYDRWGQLTAVREKVQASEYRATDYQYDDLGRLIATWLPPHEVGAARAVTQLRYDAAGDVRREIDAAGRVTERLYDRLNRIVSLHEPLDVLGLDDSSAGIDPLSTRDTSYHYFPDGNIELQIDPTGGVTRRAFDNRGKKILEIAPHGERSRWEFDRVGNETLVMDGSGNVTRFVFDALDRPVAEVLYVGNAVLSRTQAYDSMGDLVSVTDRNGREIRYGYDGAGRRVSEQWVGDPSQYSASYQYSARGELTNAADTQSMYTWQYHPSGVVDAQQLRVNVLPNKLFEAVHRHDSALQRESTTWKVNGQAEYVVGFDRDDRGRVEKVTQTGVVPSQVTRKEVTLSHTIDDRLASVLRETVRATGRTSIGHSQYEYYNDGLLGSIVHAGREPEGAWNTHAYKYDRQGRVALAESAQGKAEHFGYDPGGQLLSRDTSDDAPTEDESFRYDDSGNRMGDVHPHNQLFEDAVGRYSYDREGNVLERWRFEPIKALLPMPDVNGSLSIFVPALVRGWYRLRLNEVELLSLSEPGPVLVRIGYSQSVADDQIGIWPNFVELAVVQSNLVELGNSRYQLSESFADIPLPVNLLDAFLVVQVERLGAGIISVSGGVAHWDELDEIQRFTWDHRNRLASAEVLTADIAATSAVMVPNPRNRSVLVTAQPLHRVRYVYDVLDERIAKLFDLSTRYLSEVNVSVEGHVVADYRSDGTLLRRHLYGPAVDQLLVTEEVAVDGSAQRLV